MGYSLRGYSPTSLPQLTISGSLTMGSGAKLKIDASNSTTDCPIQVNGDPNTGFTVITADTIGAVGGGTSRCYWDGGSSGFVINGRSTVNAELTLASYLAFTQIAAPSAPAGTVARMYAVDSGASKNRVAVIFDTGVAQTVATEP